MVVGSIHYLVTKGDVQRVKGRVEAYVASGEYGFANYPQNRALPRLTFILAAEKFPIVNDLHQEWWEEIVSMRPFTTEVGEKY